MAEQTIPNKIEEISTVINEMAYSIQTLRDYLQESHEDEINNDHHGDDESTCTYCIEIDKATELLVRLGVEPYDESGRC